VLWTIGLIVVALSGPVFQLIALTLFFIGTYITVYGYFFYRNFQRRAFEDGMLLGEVSALQQEESAIASAGTDFDSLWAITQKRIDLYHEIATQQSRSSFRSGQIAAYIGFLVIIVAATIAAFTKTGTAAIAASVIGVAGAGLSAYVGSTFMKSQSASAEQLRAYFLQPVEFARVLAAERLLEKVEAGERAKVVERIVQSMTPIRDEQPPK
jgi:hypothetical protein